MLANCFVSISAFIFYLKLSYDLLMDKMSYIKYLGVCIIVIIAYTPLTAFIESYSCLSL